MPSRNEIREFASQTFYHVYNRGVEKRIIFLDDQDYVVFLGLLKKYLTGELPKGAKNRHKVAPLNKEVQLLAYCLMPNHFHLLFYQINERGITRLMQRVITGYVMYFNNRYGRVGALFQRRYKASAINADSYLHHISRYIHLNPEEYTKWPYSSLAYYRGIKHASWINTEPVLQLFQGNRAAYQQFIEDYIDTKQELAELKWQLADTTETV